MSDKEMPAILDEPIINTTASLDSSEEAPKEPPKITPEMEVKAAAGVEADFARIKAQPHERIRVPKVHGPQVVIINGARFNVPSNVSIDVPQQVAEVLREAGRI